MNPSTPIVVVLLSTVAGCGGSNKPADTGSALTCAAVATRALKSCVEDYSEALQDCLDTEGVLCDADSAGPASALRSLEQTVSAECGDGMLSGLSSVAAVERLRHACASESDSLAWRVVGGPQSAVWSDADASERACLRGAHDAGVAQIGSALAAPQRRSEAAAEAAEQIAASCDAPEALIAVDADQLAARAALQADCLLSYADPTSADLSVECGPSYAQFEANRGEWTRVEVDGDEWGTICGDGSPYSFWIRPAPAGQPLDRVLFGLQGGGVCVFEDDCGSRLERAPELFTAADDVPYSVAMVSDDPEVSPFAEWTKVYLPYCNQDVFAGGGAVEDFGSFSLPRAGAVNLRAAARMTRDWLWRELDSLGEAGYRPDRVTAMVGGWSAGSYGTLYNYHWFLDDLQWPRTVAFPDAGLALDNGEVLGVAGLGLVKIPLWGTLPNLPPYCFDGSCAVGPTLLNALSPRLLQVPEQQVLLLSNPLDDVQMADAYFSDRAVWINTMRRDFCATRDLPGVHWYLTSESSRSVHVVSIREEFWLGQVAGQTMRDWFIEAIESPETLESRAEEADFVADIAGVEPFPCDVAP